MCRVALIALLNWLSIGIGLQGEWRASAITGHMVIIGRGLRRLAGWMLTVRKVAAWPVHRWVLAPKAAGETRGLWLQFRAQLMVFFVLAFSVLALAWRVLHGPGWSIRLPDKANNDQLLDMLKIALSIVAGVGGVIALTVAYRKQHLGEAAEHRENTKLFTERFDACVARLSDDKPAARLGGVYALTHLADDWKDGRQTCISMLCAHLRMPYEPDGPDGSEQHAAFLAQREVRHTIWRLIGNHLRPGATVVSWSEHNFDFTGAVIDGADLHHAEFSKGEIRFNDAKFRGTVNFRHVRFTGSDVDFSNAKFTSGEVDFSNAKISGGKVKFDDANFIGGAVYFGGFTFSDGVVYFNSAKFAAGEVEFSDTNFVGGEVDFSDARFTGASVLFYGAEFIASSVHFGGVEFARGEVNFMNAKFPGGTLYFNTAEFTGGEVKFSNAEFTGSSVYFNYAEFTRGTVDFRQAEFTNGTIDLSLVAVYSKPPLFDPWNASPSSLKLPAISPKMTGPDK